MAKYNQKLQPGKGQPQYMQYNNVRGQPAKVKKFVIEAFEFEDKLLSQKKTLGEAEKNAVLEKDAGRLLPGAEKAVFERHRQFSFQKITKTALQGKGGAPGEARPQKREIGGLLRGLGRG